MKVVLFEDRCCAQAEKCHAMPVCPTGALRSHETKSNLVIDDELCTGCGVCIDACCGNAIAEEGLLPSQKDTSCSCGCDCECGNMSSCC